MKKFLFISVICSLLFGTAFSQNKNAGARAKTILDQVSAKTKSYKSIKVSFTFSQESKDKGTKPKITKGALSLKGSKYKLSLLGNTIYCDNVNVWTHMIEEKEVTIAKLETMDNQAFNPAKMLTIYETGFKYQFIQERFEQGKAIYIIDLFPKDIQKSEYSRIRLYIDKDKSQIWKLEYLSKDKSKYVITVNTFEPNIAMNDQDFVFPKAKFPGVQVIDER